jgi:thiol-disulfide isomerase/thioredoxin/outer membrane lipoprotein-sorting protein
MKKMFYYMMALIAILMNACTSRQVDSDAYLRQMRERLDQIQSASYTSEKLSYMPGDPNPRTHWFIKYKEYKNPTDTTIGTNFVCYSEDDSTLVKGVYDGEVDYTIFHEHKGIIRDDFTARNLPFRLVWPPFFRYAYHVINYALTTHDSIEYIFVDSVDYYKLHLITHENEQIEFVGGKAQHIYDSKPYISDPTSEYEIWFSKQTNLPYRIKRKQEHDMGDEICHNPVLNAENPADFDINDYLPQDYLIRPYKVKQRSVSDANDLLNKPAPMWTLTNLEGQAVSLKDLHAKVILLEFSATGCSPCKAAIPFLKQLREEYGKDDLLIISFESWGANDSTMKYYAEKEGLTYPFIRATEEMLSAYKTGGSAPWFFLLDRGHFIRKAFWGYSEGTTDKEIIETINTYINK